jgi:hypothetical protein
VNGHGRICLSMSKARRPEAADVRLDSSQRHGKHDDESEGDAHHSTVFADADRRQCRSFQTVSRGSTPLSICGASPTRDLLNPLGCFSRQFPGFRQFQTQSPSEFGVSPLIPVQETLVC